MSDYKLPPEVLEILNRSTITENSLKLPPGQLDRKLYEAVNKAILFAGGKWNRSAGAHLFTSDPRKKLGLILDTGVAVDLKKKFQSFYTPELLARRVVQMASVEGKRVLEPSAGNGALANECLTQGATMVDCIEIDPEMKSVLESDVKPVIIGDFMRMQHDHFGCQHERVTMNPPFQNRQDLKHVGHAKRFLKSGGRLVAIMQGNREAKEIRKFVGENCDIIQHPIEAGEFKESGTGITTQIVIIDL
jgi:predicted RNA methylase